MDERRIHQAFEISILLKGAHAIVECIGGLVLALVSTTAITGLVNAITQDELVEDPHDFLATHLQAFAASFSITTKNFYAFYLLSYGVVKLVLVIGLLRNQLWAYPATLVSLVGFIVYQIYRYVYMPSFGLIILTVLDLIVIALVWHEYKLVRRHVYGTTS